jgi:hypothetical protein
MLSQLADWVQAALAGFVTGYCAITLWRDRLRQRWHR